MSKLDLRVSSNLTYNQKLEILDDIKASITLIDKSFIGILAFIHFEVLKEEHGLFNEVAFTNGQTIFFGDFFFNFPDPEKRGILIHEVLHIALAHPSRGKDKLLPSLWNIAIDALVNATVTFNTSDDSNKNHKYTWYLNKERSVCLETLLDNSVGISEEDKNKRASEWTSEELYHCLLNGLYQDLQDQVSSKSDTPSDSNGSDLEQLENKVKDLIDKLREELKDLIDGNDIKREVQGKRDDQNINDQMMQDIWSKRVERAKQIGSKKGNSIFDLLSNELSKPKIPWRQALREFLRTRCLPSKEITFTKPGRRMLALASQSPNSPVHIFLPGVQPEQGLDNLTILFDTSGSCFFSEEMTAFISEINAIQEYTQCTLELYFADTEIQDHITVLNDGISLATKISQKKIQPKGGGGTNMAYALKEIFKTSNPFLTAVFTDGYTPYPEPHEVRNHNILWVLSCDVDVPDNIGKVLYIK